MIEKMEWLGHDTFKIESGGKVIYTDPFKLFAGLPKADLIFVTHEHYDHCSPEDVAKIALFLASDLSSWVVGDIVLADGGTVAVKDVAEIVAEAMR